ncbi:Nse1 non-SMC component of SMC5-6 complex-domain-containing protein [Annulohypoxylon truncatum]|uniref:Nse1 non-SMC component of SMC5-6 complex-domain-containing protein n=1 Tax=Annulohypoxylon truncatum TaxID=327061 RepID=UPI002008E8F6|nr:Nse1 non-SMC component of SMC5-6 complex-domain-containing protein [Annulohypoxylon truncatum]KAI1214134.1 Nse1 non-SMC component of SMC5-6 complex-domain-containing protein [Annulohypoxylon truncatum]
MDEDEIPHQYDDSNRAFLQAFMARGTLTFAQARPILAAIFTASEKMAYARRPREDPDNPEPEPTQASQVTREDFESYVSAASEAASAFDYEIRSATHQATKERVYALVNVAGDGPTQMATLRTAEEGAFVRRVVDAMFERYNTQRMETICLDGMQANKLRTAPREVEEFDGNGEGERENGDGEGGATQTVAATRGLKSSEVENVMRSMVDEGWFERSANGFYSLAPRALIELRSWLVDAYNDAEAAADEWQRVKFCEACREIVTWGQRCADRDCNARLHDVCGDAFWRVRGGGERTCPRCGVPWTGRNFVGERAITETEAWKKGARRSGKGRASLVQRNGEEEEE